MNAFIKRVKAEIMEKAKALSTSMNNDMMACIEACAECAAACEYCASECLAGNDAAMTAGAIKACTDCANMCRATASATAMSGAQMSGMCDLCAKSAAACAAECAKHPTIDCCVECAQECSDCAEQCANMAKGGSGNTAMSASMHKHSLPQARQFERKNGMEWDLSPRALEMWTPNLMAAAPVTDNTISILDPIGIDPWTGDGVTAKRIGAALRSIGAESDVVVNINSPGGDWSEGNTIYNMLRDHKGKVQMKVLGMAASAASLIAMAGDEILIAKSAFLMMHNMWCGVIGNANDLRAIADMLDPFDLSMAEIYAARSGLDLKVVQKMMDKETRINGTDSVDQGFADALMPADQVKQDPNAKQDQIAGYVIEMALAKGGMSRSNRRTLLQDYKSGTPRAAGAGTPRATADDTPRAVVAGENELMAALRSFSIEHEKETS
jgi:ATP-dependent Clp protease protease subunit